MLTRQQLESDSLWLRDTAHLNGGEVFFGHLDSCVTYPRLQRVVKYYKADRSTKITWSVDGNYDVETIEEAIELLSKAPVFSEEETAALKLIDDTWKRMRGVADVLILINLRRKGAIEASRGGYYRLHPNAKAGWKDD